jgi:16S rRNA (uracil1498-N3)-methyltransferase
MPRIFLLDSEVRPGVITLTHEKARYLSTVLRCKAGDPLTVKDNRGGAYTATIIGIGKKEVKVEILQRLQLNTESPLGISLLQSLLKGEKMDFVIQKATELGVKEIRPVLTERSQVIETRKLPRWRKIAEEASRQCGRDIIPLIHEPVDFSSLFGGVSRPSGDGIIFWEKGGEALSEALTRFSGCSAISLVTGPEGGFSENEMRQACACGFVAATLGKRILRAETAAIAAVSIAQFALGDLGSCSHPSGESEERQGPTNMDSIRNHV